MSDDAALAGLLRQARDDPDMLRHLGALSAPLFEPKAEAAALHRTVAKRLET